MLPLPPSTQQHKLKCAIFLSGSGTNASKLLGSCKKNSAWQPALIVTDRINCKKAFELSSKYKLPLIVHDIKEFYQQRGECSIRLDSINRQKLREQWTCSLEEKIALFDIDFLVFAGFIPLTNIVKNYPTLNIHPADLTKVKNGKPLLTGLHTEPIEKALLLNMPFQRSTVILAQPYSKNGIGVDSGPILGLSTPIQLKYYGYNDRAFKKCIEQRKIQQTTQDDILRIVAKRNLQRLKEKCDWVILPKVVEDFAAGNVSLSRTQSCSKF